MVDMSSKGFFAGLFRELIASLDSFIYKLLAGIYNVFFNVATADVLQAQMLKALFGRIQIILGVIILFKLVISFFSGVVNPDSLNDQKKGFGSIIKRVVVVLVMLLMIVPLNIPRVNMDPNVKLTGMASWNRNMNNHGILFGSLYELEKRVLNERLIFKLINGEQPTQNKEDEYNEQRDAGEKFSLDVLKTFIMPNVIEEGASFDDECKNEGDTQCVCWYEKAESGENPSRDKDDVKLAMKVYFSNEASIDQLLSEDVITAFCRDVSTKAANMEKDGNKVWTNAYYALAYSKLWSTIIGVLFCVLLLSLTVDVAVRLFKLVLLEVISPIAILSYIDSSSEKTFKNWTKVLAETYLALFIRIAIISFILFIVNNISTSFGLQNPKGFVGFVSKILIYFGLIMFAKEAPKFITQSLGIESKEGNGLFSGFGKIWGATTMARGIVGSAISDAKVKYGERLENPKTANHRIRNAASSIISGITGGVGGAVTGTKALATSDKDYSKNVMNAQRNRNQLRASGSTAFGRWKDRQSQLFTGQSLAERDEARAKAYNDVFDKSKALKDALESEGKKHGRFGSVRVQAQGDAHAMLHNFNFERLLAAMKTADEHGNFVYEDARLGIAARTYNAADFDTNTLNTILDSQIDGYQAGMTDEGRTAYNNNGTITSAQRMLARAVDVAGTDYRNIYNDGPVAGSRGNVNRLLNRSSTDKTTYATDQRHRKNVANKQANDNN